MSDAPNDIPLDPGTNTTPPPDSNSANFDPNSNNTGDSDSGVPSGSNTSTVNDPLGGGTDTPTSGFDQNGANSGIPDSVNQNPTTAQESQLVPGSSSPIGSGLQPTASPNSIADTNGSHSSNVPLSLGSKSNSSTKTIIIASSVSGGVALILALVVIFFVYRRRNTRRRDAKFVNAIPELERRGSDATWIGPAAGKSFEDDNLEAGNRNSDASFESEATLADVAAARAKSGAFSTPSHTPRPSIDKIKTDLQPMVPEDPFEKPRLSLADGQRPPLDQAAPQPVAFPRQRKSGAPNMRINSDSRFNSMVELEQGDIVGPQSPEFVLPLVTPIGPPPGWRGSRVDYIRAPTRRDSIISLSRQSSRASSRNSQIIDPDDAPGKRSSVKAIFNSALAKKRRSRADSIDPFRKSSATMMSARRKSRAESVVSSRYHAYGAPAAGPGARRKSRAESIAPPTTPGGRRKSRAASIAPSVAPRRRSQAASSASSPRQSVFTTPVEYMPPAAIGLPRTPRTPTAAMARQSRIPDAPVPRTPTARTPRTAGPREPRTPSTREPRTPSTREPRTPVARESRTPVAREPRTPMTARETSYSAREPLPRTPASARDPRTPRTPGGHPRVPSARVPRTPTSLEDAVHWSDIPLPAVPPPPSEQPRPLPSVPATTPTKAELRLSQLSRALSEVSSRDSHY
ncbi:hypothetical protein GY45DRAFT_634254 [Cubamyces sp. BRFM 1775]|nr:hypothetical protein GY45DRAFT_634254 [Cubamyces sp. BRFM 1775]